MQLATFKSKQFQSELLQTETHINSLLRWISIFWNVKIYFFCLDILFLLKILIQNIFITGTSQWRHKTIHFFFNLVPSKFYKSITWTGKEAFSKDRSWLDFPLPVVATCMLVPTYQDYKLLTHKTKIWNSISVKTS